MTAARYLLPLVLLAGCSKRPVAMTPPVAPINCEIFTCTATGEITNIAPVAPAERKKVGPPKTLCVWNLEGGGYVIDPCPTNDPATGYVETETPK